MKQYKGLNILRKRAGKNVITVVGLFAMLHLIGTTRLFAQTVWLDQLELGAATQGFGTPGKNKSVEGKNITIAGKTFERGFGTHAESSLLILLDGKAMLLTLELQGFIYSENKGPAPSH
jgi:alpha-galactosidase